MHACMDCQTANLQLAPTLVQKRTGLQTVQNRKGTESGLVLPSIAEESLFWITECISDAVDQEGGRQVANVLISLLRVHFAQE